MTTFQLTPEDNAIAIYGPGLNPPNSAAGDVRLLMIGYSIRDGRHAVERILAYPPKLGNGAGPVANQILKGVIQ